MYQQQERARRTRHALLDSAAMEFSRHGYAAASVNSILEAASTTKGAMYFHFDSKETLARSVLHEGYNEYLLLVSRWVNRTDLSPLDLLHGMVLDLADMIKNSVFVQAESHFILEQEFHSDVKRSSLKYWKDGVLPLVLRAKESGQLPADVEPYRFVRVLSACIVGQRLSVDFSQDGTLAQRFEESLEIIMAAMASDQWLERFHTDGWASLDPVLD